MTIGNKIPVPLAPELLDAALKAAAGQGYDLGQLKYTVQGGQAALPAR